MTDPVGEHVITFFGPHTLITRNDLWADVDEVLSAPDIVTVNIPERLWWPLVELVAATENHLGLILNTYEQEWIEGRENVEFFGRTCTNAIGADQRLDSTLSALSELANRQAATGLPIVIDT